MSHRIETNRETQARGGQDSQNCCTSFYTSKSGRCIDKGTVRLNVRILRFKERNFWSYSAAAFSMAALYARLSLSKGGTRRVRSDLPWLHRRGGVFSLPFGSWRIFFWSFFF